MADKPKKKKNAAARALANLRMKSMTPERRKEIAQAAIEKRWADVRRKRAEEEKPE